MKIAELKAPFPFFGGKSFVADLVWQRFGDVKNFVDPFCGSCAVLLGRPQPFSGSETVNDLNAWLSNVWRCLRFAPKATARFCDWPVSELDSHSRGDALFYRTPEIRSLCDTYGYSTHCKFSAECPCNAGLGPWQEWLRGDANRCCACAGGVWIWGACAWIGSGWGSANMRKDGTEVCRMLPHLGDAGRGVNRKLADGMTRGEMIRLYFRQLSKRLRNVRVCCGDWQRVLSNSPTTHLGLTAVYFDPPYASTDRDTGVYGDTDSTTVAHDVRAWCLEHGGDPLLRIALCGYDGEHDELEQHGWSVVAWKARGGHGNQRTNGTTNENRGRERIWYSPHCLTPANARTLFD